MIRYRAAWVLPISSPPIADAVVAVEAGRIVSVDRARAGDVVDLGNVAVLPGLVNAHTHLELSWMRGRVPPATSMPAWAAALIAGRRAAGADAPEPIVTAIAEARASGTTLVGDVANTLAPYAPLADSALSAVLFRELIGFAAPDPDALVSSAAAQLEALPAQDRLRTSIVPHAPYSVSPDLMRAIGRHARGRPVSLHLGESLEEVQFLADGTGAWRALLDSLGAWNAAWMPPACDPVGYIDGLGLLTSNLLAVHGVQLTDAALRALATAGATLVTCPRSNRWTGAGDPPVERFYRSGVRVAVGTDSLASVDDLNMFAELHAVRELAPSVPARAILQSGTMVGAVALGFGEELGTLERGKRAELIAVRIPAGVEDVEECLLTGVETSDVRWLGEETLNSER